MGENAIIDKYVTFLRRPGETSIFEHADRCLKPVHKKPIS